jgi:uncharacterized protein
VIFGVREQKPDMGETGFGPVAITGASGLIGSALRRSLEADGIEVRALVRTSGEGGIHWNPVDGTIDREGLEGVRGVVHLAGENIGGGRWTETRKARILDSRARGTRLLAEALATMREKPEVLVSMSGIHYYGLRGSEALTEETSAGEGFLADVCKTWEASAEPAREAGIRVVHPRAGVVLAPEGGALEKMRLPFKLGVGGRIGQGSQYMSWISLPDLVAVLRRALEDPSLVGPINAVAPEPVTNAEFARALGDTLHRPSALPLPAFAAKALLGGEMAEQLLLGGQRAVPRKLERAGFQFTHRRIEQAFAYTERGVQQIRTRGPHRRQPV